MTKYILAVIFVHLVVSPCVAGIQISNVSSADDLGHLRNEIAKLEAELASNTEKLNACASKNKNFKIAGIATIGLTSAGVATNIALHSKAKNQEKQAHSMLNKIKMAEAEVDEFAHLLENVDQEKFTQELKKTLTDDELKRLAEIYEMSDDKALSDSDKVLLAKIIKVAKNSQK